MIRKHSSRPSAKTFKAVPSVRKIKANVFLKTYSVASSGSPCPIRHLSPTVMVWYTLDVTTTSHCNRPGLLRHDAIILHGGARLQTSNRSCDWLRRYIYGSLWATRATYGRLWATLFTVPIKFPCHDGQVFSTPSVPGLNPTQAPTGRRKVGFRQAENEGCEAVHPPSPPEQKLITHAALTQFTYTSASRGAQN